MAGTGPWAPLLQNTSDACIPRLSALAASSMKQGVQADRFSCCRIDRTPRVTLCVTTA